MEVTFGGRSRSSDLGVRARWRPRRRPSGRLTSGLRHGLRVGGLAEEATDEIVVAAIVKFVVGE